LQAAAFILSLIKAIPALEKIFSSVVELYYVQVDVADQNRVTAKEKKKTAIFAALKSGEISDENKNNLRRILYDISRN
jgi:hypothetical protein